MDTSLLTLLDLIHKLQIKESHLTYYMCDTLSLLSSSVQVSAAHSVVSVW